MDPLKKKSARYAWMILIGCCFMQAGGLGAVLDAAGVFFVPVCEDLGFSRSEISLYLTFYFLSTIVAMPFVGKLISRFNINVVLSLAFGLVTCAVAAMSFYNAPYQWWISGVIFGLAGSFIFVVPTPILIGNWFHAHKGIALGVAMSFSGIGGAVLSPIFTLFIEMVGWREAYLLAALVMAVIVLPWTLFVFKLHPEDIGLIPYGYDSGTDKEAMDEALKDEQKGISARKAIRTIPFWCMFLFAGLIAYFAGFNSHLPGFAQSIGFSPMVGSSLLTAVMIGNVIEKYIVGYLNDKIGVHLTVNIQLVMVALGLLGFIVAGDNLVLIYISAFLFGAQNSLVSVSNPLLVRELFGGREYPQIYTNVCVGTGAIGCLGPVTIASIFDTTNSFIPAFAIGICVAIVGFISVRVAFLFEKTVQQEEA